MMFYIFKKHFCVNEIATGRSVVSNFSRDWRVASIGLSRNEEASLNVLLTSNEKPQEYISRVKE